MTTSTPAPVRTTDGRAVPVRARRLTTATWVALLVWPLTFVLGVLPVILLYPEGDVVGHGVLVDTTVRVVGLIGIVGPPLVSFVLGSMAFRLGARWNVLLAPGLLTLLMALWGYQYHAETDGWWGLIAAALAAVVLACVSVLPRAVGSRSGSRPEHGPPPVR